MLRGIQVYTEGLREFRIIEYKKDLIMCQVGKSGEVLSSLRIWLLINFYLLWVFNDIIVVCIEVIFFFLKVFLVKELFGSVCSVR